jgi:hypothetical protein
MRLTSIDKEDPMTNPGLFDEDIDYSNSIDPALWSIPVGLAVVFAITLALHLIVTRGKGAYRLILAAGIIAAPLLAIFVISYVGGTVRENEHFAARSAYEVDVQTWLEDGFGITADIELVSDLLDGGSAVATVSGGDTVSVSLSRTTDGDLAVLDEHRTPLTAISTPKD